MTRPSLSVTSSAWYWVYLFCTAGIVALVLMGPKFASRQTQIEQKYQARQRAALLVAGRQLDPPPERAAETSITLWPLYTILGCVWLLSGVQLARLHLRARSSKQSENIG